jgi:hypothetical protein
MSTAADRARTADDEPWFDELLPESDGWVVALVTTPKGRRIRYRIMVAPA